MGTCSGLKANDKKPTISKESKFSEEESELLKLMYENLAIRCKNKILSREVFGLFFHISGLLGEVMYSKFDPMKSGTVTFEAFKRGLEVMVKGDFKQKADVLFEVYDIDKKNGISFKEFLKMLYSYPIEDLKVMLTEEKFLNYIGEGQLHYYFGPENKIEEKAVLEEASENNESSFPMRKGSTYSPTTIEFLELQKNFDPNMQKNFDEDEKKISLGLKSPYENRNIKENINNNEDFFNEKRENNVYGVKRMMSIPELGLIRNRKSLQIKSNISTLIKKYAVFLFGELNIDKETGSFSSNQFYLMLKNHPSIFNVYFTGFHTYVWMIEHDEPEFKTALAEIEGDATEIYKDKKEEVYLKFVSSTIFVFFEKKKMNRPKEIISLIGLTVEEKGERSFTFKHHDGIYPEKEYHMPSHEIMIEWMKHLSYFKKVTIFATYTLMEKIGAGSFSTVYKGIENATNKQVAIKVIENFRLTANEKEVLQRECSIMNLCHHPNIIKFYGEFKIKTHQYIVMELLSEGDLFEYTKKNTFLEEYEAAIIFKQLADCMNYLNQELGIIHRDLKPENVMIITTEDHKLCKKIKIIDFGFAVYKDKLIDLPAASRFAGTPGFIAPEVLYRTEYDDKVDAFSLGIILYFMLSGYFPFHSNYNEEIIDLTKKCDVSLTNAHWLNVSENAKDLINKLLKFKDKRISTRDIQDHSWLKNIETLKEYNGKNKKNNKYM